MGKYIGFLYTLYYARSFPKSSQSLVPTHICIYIYKGIPKIIMTSYKYYSAKERNCLPEAKSP